MSVDKLVDSTQLDTDLTSVANAIRTKGGTSGQLAFPDGFVSAIQAISGGDEPLFNPYGQMCYKKMTVVVKNPAAVPVYQYCDIEEAHFVLATGTSAGNPSAGAGNVFYRCAKLEKATIETYKIFGHYFFLGCTALQEATLGKVGIPVSALTTLTFSGCTQTGLTITIYVADETAIPLANSPFGATNATIIYRSSTTGEVRTA